MLGHGRIGPWGFGLVERSFGSSHVDVERKGLGLRDMIEGWLSGGPSGAGQELPLVEGNPGDLNDSGIDGKKYMVND